MLGRRVAAEASAPAVRARNPRRLRLAAVANAGTQIVCPTYTGLMSIVASSGLVIFDCDGVLVDSEGLGCGVVVDMLGELGYPMDFDAAVAFFKGRKMAECVVDIERMLGRAVPEGFVPEFRARSADAFRRELKAIPGVEQALDLISSPTCVASSGPMEKIRLSLGLTGLLPRFDGRLFSAYEVGIWKPDPGLFLHAAQAMGSAPEVCTVVEDSVPGVLAGLAAGMRVLGYAHSEAEVEVLQGAGAQTFRAMAELPGLLGQPA